MYIKTYQTKNHQSFAQPFKHLPHNNLCLISNPTNIETKNLHRTLRSLRNQGAIRKQINCENQTKQEFSDQVIGKEVHKIKAGYRNLRLRGSKKYSNRSETAQCKRQSVLKNIERKQIENSLKQVEPNFNPGLHPKKHNKNVFVEGVQISKTEKIQNVNEIRMITEKNRRLVLDLSIKANLEKEVFQPKRQFSKAYQKSYLQYRNSFKHQTQEHEKQEIMNQYHRIRAVSQKRSRKSDKDTQSQNPNNRSFECFHNKKIPDINPWIVQGDDDQVLF